HEKAAIADAGQHAAALRARIHGDAFANDIVPADFQPGGLAAVLQILRCMADRCEGIDAGTGAYDSDSRDHDMADEHHPVAQFHLRTDMAIRPYLDVSAQPGTIFDNGGRVNLRHRPTSYRGSWRRR